MSISLDYALEHKNDPAVLCCRAEAGTVLSEHNLEDPAIFDDLVDSNLLDLTGALKIGQVLGATLKETCDSLTALTADKVEGAKEGTDEPAAEASKTEDAAAPDSFRRHTYHKHQRGQGHTYRAARLTALSGQG